MACVSSQSTQLVAPSPSTSGAAAAEPEKGDLLFSAKLVVIPRHGISSASHASDGRDDVPATLVS